MNKGIEKFVLLTSNDLYYSEYLFNKLLTSENISEARVFESADSAKKIQTFLFENCEIVSSINTFIPS